MSEGNILLAIEEGQYENTIPYSKENQADYRAEEGRIVARFQADLEAVFGTKMYSRKQALFNKAWADGHSSGYQDVYNQYAELVELIEPSALARVDRVGATL